MLAQDTKPASLPDQFDLEKLSAFITDQVEREELIGLSVAIVRGGEPVFVRAFGKKQLAVGGRTALLRSAEAQSSKMVEP
jgi:CubicO group peptidase (beta-lactamase class C family)